MPITKSCKQLVQEAREKVTTLSLEEAAALHSQPGVQFVDIRDKRELEREGTIPGSFHAPRGMLEFWVDPESPYFKPIFGQDLQFVLFCASAWRSSLAAAALKDMGMDNVSHFEGGFTAWKKGGLPTEAA